MKAKERYENIKVFEDLIQYIEENLNYITYLCHMDIIIRKPLQGGYNTRMIPNAMEYLKSQMPTSRKNKDFFKALYFDRISEVFQSWWIYPKSHRVPTNMEKIRFLKHLIQKLK